MWVTVPVTDRSRSPSTSETPTAAPGARSGACPGLAPPPPPTTAAKPIEEKTPRAQAKVSGSKPENTSGRESGRSVAPARPAGSASPRKAPGARPGSGRAKAAATASPSSGAAKDAPLPPSRSRAEAARGAPGDDAASSMSPIGVMPAIGSLPNGNAYATAPSSRPFTYTGLPLIPAMTPVRSSGPPSSRARIRLWPGPTALSSTPRMRTRKLSIVAPSNTVRPSPCMPARTSDSGSIAGRVSPRAATGTRLQHTSRAWRTRRGSIGSC